VRTKASITEQGIQALQKRRREYERYFRTLKKEGATMDHQAQTAYINIIKTLVELEKKSLPETGDPERMKRLAAEILENDYGIKRPD